MSNMNEQDSRLLPPLSMLRCLEAAVRGGSFSNAADMLGLTQSAVSRQIAALEDWLGVSLFERRGRRVAVNATGLTYLADIAPALASIRRATANHVSAPQIQSIELATLPSFGMRWLAPRLPRLTARHPGMIVNIAARVDIFGFAREPFDAAIHVGASDWPDAAHDLLFREHVVPVVAPALAREYDIRTAADFLRLPLLVQSARRDAWRRWFALSGLSLPSDHQPVSSAAHFLMLAEAVRAGTGAALMPSFLIQPELEAGQLLVPVDLSLADNRNYYLVYPEDRLKRPVFREFRDWICTEAEATLGIGP
ncbi:MAG: LysR substrate-binding domain-containing protein [Sphingomonas sp.]